MSTTNVFKRTAATALVTVAAALAIAFTATPIHAASANHPVTPAGVCLNHPCFT